MNIGEAARQAGVTSKMIRHYESINLISAPPRTNSGYRVYSSAAVHELRFIKRSRFMGFSLDQISELLSLWRNKARTSAEVKQLANQQIKELDSRISQLVEMRSSLKALAVACHGDTRPDCPILSSLGSDDKTNDYLCAQTAQPRGQLS